MLQLEKGEPYTPESIFEQTGFRVSERIMSRSSCFDLAARRNGTLVFLKCQQDVGNMSPIDSYELKAISKTFSGFPIMVGEQAHGKKLEDDTVYTRNGLQTITHETFNNVMLKKMLPLIRANPGGCYVEINGEAIKLRRQELGLSVGDLAKIAGISRRTLYGYERGMAKASVSVAYNLIYSLGIPIAKPIDIFLKQEHQSKPKFLIAARRILESSSILNKIIKKFGKLYPTTVTKKAPFDFIMAMPDEKIRLIGAIAKHDEPSLDIRVKEIVSLGKVVRAPTILITEDSKPPCKDILCVNQVEISVAKNLKDLVSSIK